MLSAHCLKQDCCSVLNRLSPIAQSSTAQSSLEICATFAQRGASLCTRPFTHSDRTCISRRSAQTDQADQVVAEVADADWDDLDNDMAEQYSEMRPWTYLIPTLEEVADNRQWPVKVADWKTFWAMFSNWMWVYQQLLYLEENDKTMDEDVAEQMEWLQIDPHILAGNVGKLVKVIDSVIEMVPEMMSSGIPVPDEIGGKMIGHTGMRTRKYKVNEKGHTFIDFGKVEGSLPVWDAKPVPERKIDSSSYAETARPWDDWDEWEHRVYMEKQRSHRRKRAQFAKKQAEIGKWKHLVVSPTTDAQWAQDSYFYPINERDYTHEEIMHTVTMQGQATDPLKIPIVVVDPDTHADAFAEGVHYCQDTIDYIRDIGHLCEREEDLIGDRQEGVPSATLEEEFSEDRDSPLDDLDTDISGGADMDSMSVVNEDEALDGNDFD